MTSCICTLFEGHYHYGVAALTNSLYYQGYRGAIFAGYRGTLPSWSAAAQENPALNWPGSRTLVVAEGLQLHFLPLDTDYHLTNYKPDFMLRLWSALANEATVMFYFDPDIIVTTPWSLFEQWVQCGVALCEDVNSPLSEYHPTRVAWRNYFGIRNFLLNFKEAIYANGGFVGVSKESRGFLTTWQQLQEAMAPAIGGLSHSAFSVADPLPFAPFGKTDQDALNASVEAWEGTVSFVGQEGMAFKSGTPIMPHALGKLKPWLRQPLLQSIAGQPPRLVDKYYWQFANDPIISQQAGLIWRRKLAIRIASLIGRFYSRN
jgi:hypothetical protein